MPLKSLETKWKAALSSILEELTDSEFKKLLFNLNKIPQSVKANRVREEIPQIIIQYFGTEKSISVIDREMKQIPRMDAAVQDLLRPFVDKLKLQSREKKEVMSKAAAKSQKPATDSGSVAKKQKPATDSGSVAKKQKPATDSGSVAKKQKPATDSGSVAKKQKPATDSGSVAKKQKPATDSGSVAKKQKPAGAGTTSKVASDSGSVAKRQKPAAGSECAVHPGKVKTAGIKKASRKTAPLEAQLNNQLQTFVTPHLPMLSFILDDDF